MTKHRVNPDARCPACLQKIDAAVSPYSNDFPTPGDFSVCIACTVVLVYQTDLTLRIAKSDEIERIDPDVRGQLNTIRSAIQRWRKHAKRID